jgi:predicted TIM-barrel fold metal-dependent hydrolase
MDDLLISADSHVMEPVDLWRRALPAALKDSAPTYPDYPVGTGLGAHPGGQDPHLRVGEMAQDGVSGEVLYPTRAMDQFGLPDAALQEHCVRIYNDWLSDYCRVAPERLYGIGMISTYTMAHAVSELERCKQHGLRGAMIWQVPPPELAFTTDHYDPFWAAAQDLELPVSLHIVTGAPYGPRNVLMERTAANRLAYSVNLRLLHGMNALSDIIASGVLERFPRLKIVLVENEVGWLPFVLNQWDKYATRYTDPRMFQSSLTMLPSEYFRRQVFVTFFNDPLVRTLGQDLDWVADNCMWSSDYPHPNSTWPRSREVIARDLGEFTSEAQTRLVSGNVTRLYGLPQLVAA